MNQEQNNLNQNNFNIQGNNGIPNNQPLQSNQDFNPTFNQSVVPNTNVNQPTFNPQPTVEPMQQPVQPQQMPSYQQPSMQEPTLQPVNPVESGNTSNQNFNSKPPKKMNLGLIIGIVAAVAVVGAVIAIFIFSSKDGNKSGIGNNNSNSQKNSNIKQISITSSDIVTLTNNGDLYYIGDEFSTFFDSGNEDYKDLKKVASNVEKFYNNNAAVYYIDKQQDLYYFGSSYNAGSSSEIKKDYSGAKDIVAYMNFCGFVIKNNDELYVKNNGFGNDYCGLNIEYKEFTKVADDVIKIFANGYYGGYINSNNELYLTTSNTEFKKILDNVSSVSVYGFRTLFIITKDNKLYIYDDKTWDNVDNYELKLLREDVNELGENYFKTINGEYNVFSSRSDLGLIKDESKILYESNDNIYYGTLDVADIKEILYYDSSVSYDFDSGKNNEQKKLIYISNDDKLVLLDKNNNKKIAYNTNSLKEIFEFVISKNLVED